MAPMSTSQNIKKLLETIKFRQTPQKIRVCFVIMMEGDLVMSAEHLGPAYLTSVLRNAGAECSIFEIYPKDNLTEKSHDIAEFKPDIVGFTLTMVSVNRITVFGQQLRNELGDAVCIVGGGVLATHLHDSLLQDEKWRFMDSLIRGEGEIPILQLAETIQKQTALEGVNNLVYRQNGMIQHNRMLPLIPDLDILPLPARDQMANSNSKLPYLRISTSRGCTSHCTFCNAPHTKNRLGKGSVWRGRSAEQVVDEIDHLYRTYKYDTFDFIDSTFEDPGGNAAAKTRIAEIADRILDKQLKIYFNCCFQAKNWQSSDIPLIHLLWRAGLEKVLVGIESGSERGLRTWQKKSSVKDNKTVIELLTSQSIYVAFGFISFHPWSGFNEVKQNVGFLGQNMGHNLRRYTVRLELYPGAEVIELLKAEELLDESFIKSLNPFGYKYKDNRMQNLASNLNQLYGDQYEEQGRIAQEPAVFKFETYDIVLHTYRSRLLRLMDGHQPGSDILAKCESDIQVLKNEMTDYNQSLVSHFIDLAEKDSLPQKKGLQHQNEVEIYYSRKIEQLQSCQLRASMHLHRAGYNVRKMLAPLK